MELTRRDALAALLAAGAAVGGGALLERRLDGVLDDADTNPEDLLPALTAAAEVVFPSRIEEYDAFVETFVIGRIESREAYLRGMSETVTELNQVARDWHDAPFPELSPETRDELLRSLDADVSEPVPDGILGQRLRHYVVNELLYALYSSPKGGRLVGIENPIGHPGGTQSYQQPTMSPGTETPASDSNDEQ